MGRPCCGKLTSAPCGLYRRGFGEPRGRFHRPCVCGRDCGERRRSCAPDPAGAIDTTFSGVPGKPAEVAVDQTGANIAVVSWMGGITNFLPPGSDPGYALARLAPDNVTWTTLATPQEPFPSGLAVAANGDIVANGLDSTSTFYVERIDAAGKTVFSIVVQGTYGGSIGSRTDLDGFEWECVHRRLRSVIGVSGQE